MKEKRKAVKKRIENPKNGKYTSYTYKYPFLDDSVLAYEMN